MESELIARIEDLERRVSFLEGKDVDAENMTPELVAGIIIDWTERKKQGMFTFRELFEGVKARVKRTAILERGVRLLVGQDRLRVIPIQVNRRGRKPSARFVIVK